MSRTTRRDSLVAKGLLCCTVVALTALMAACGSDQPPINPVVPSSPPAAAGAAADGASAGKLVTQWVEGTLEGRFDFTEMWGDEWYEIYAHTDTTGTLRHLGLTRMHTRHTPDFTTGTLADGQFTLVAANGDEISGTYVGTAVFMEDATGATATIPFVVTGGTGRFARATGSLTASLVEIFDDPTWASAKATWTLAGPLTY